MSILKYADDDADNDDHDDEGHDVNYSYWRKDMSG